MRKHPPFRSQLSSGRHLQAAPSSTLSSTSISSSASRRRTNGGDWPYRCRSLRRPEHQTLFFLLARQNTDFQHTQSTQSCQGLNTIDSQQRCLAVDAHSNILALPRVLRRSKINVAQQSFRKRLGRQAKWASTSSAFTQVQHLEDSTAMEALLPPGSALSYLPETIRTHGFALQEAQKSQLPLRLHVHKARQQLTSIMRRSLFTTRLNPHAFTARRPDPSRE